MDQVKCGKHGIVYGDQIAIRTNKNGRIKRICKQCRKIWHAEWIKNNPEKNKINKSNYYKKHKDQCGRKQKEWKDRNKLKVIALSRKHEKNKSQNLTDSYIRKKCRQNTILRPEDISPEWIDAKREHLKLIRLLRDVNRIKK